MGAKKQTAVRHNGKRAKNIRSKSSKASGFFGKAARGVYSAFDALKVKWYLLSVWLMRGVIRSNVFMARRLTAFGRSVDETLPRFISGRGGLSENGIRRFGLTAGVACLAFGLVAFSAGSFFSIPGIEDGGRALALDAAEGGAGVQSGGNRDDEADAATVNWQTSIGSSGLPDEDVLAFLAFPETGIREPDGRETGVSPWYVAETPYPDETIPEDSRDTDMSTATKQQSHATKVVMDIPFAEYRTEPRIDWDGCFIWPADGTVTSRYGYRTATVGSTNHKGLDISGKNGDAIYAADGGEVIYSGYDGRFGRVVRILHESGVITVYAHCSSLLVDRGDIVEQGRIIAGMGMSGTASGVHLHFEVIINGENVNPIKYLP